MDPTLITIGVFTLASLCLLLIAIVVFYLRLTSRYLELEKVIVSKNKGLVAEKEKVFQQAQEEAMKLINESHRKAQELLTNSSSFSASTQNMLIEEVKKATVGYQKQYEFALETFKKGMDGVYQNVTSDISSDSKKAFAGLQVLISKEIEDLKKELAAQMGTFQNSLKGVVDEERKRIATEFEKVKEEKLNKLNEKIVDAVLVVAKEFIEVGLNTKEKEDVIFRSLDKAKKDKLFD